MMVVEMTKSAFHRGSAVFVSFMIVAEMTGFALSAWTRNVFWHPDGCNVAEYAFPPRFSIVF